MKKLLQKAMFLLLAFAFPTMTFADIYVVGDSKELTWDLPGTRYEANQNGIYILELNNVRNFKFSTVETDDWNDLNENSYLPNSVFTDDVYGDNGQTRDLVRGYDGVGNITLPWLGDYVITINLNKKTINAKTLTPKPIPNFYIIGEMN